MSANLDPRYLPFINKSSQVVDPDAPRLMLLMDPYMGSPADSAELCITTPYMIQFTNVRPSDDRHTRPITYRWSAWESMAKGQFVLLHETAAGHLEQVEVSMLGGLVDSMYSEEEDETSLSEPQVREGAPGDRWAPICHLTANYQTKLTPGEKYHLIWPGAEIQLWEWGVKEELQSNKLIPHKDKQAFTPALMLPPAGGIIFKAYEAEEPFPDREKYIQEDGPHASYDTANEIEQDWRYEQERRRENVPRGSEESVAATERTEGAPVLSYEIVQASAFETVSRITYEASSSDRPITLHKWPIRSKPCQLYVWQEDKWVTVPDDSNVIACFPDLDDSELDVVVGEDNNDFLSLQPGESWVDETHYHTPSTCKPGDKFKFAFAGTALDWWDWGSKQDHMTTVVTLPSFAFGDVQIPADNGGRPKVVVPASNEVEFVWKA